MNPDHLLAPETPIRRRTVLRLACAAVAGSAFGWGMAAEGAVPAARPGLAFGVCSGLNNAGMLHDAGAEYVEDSATGLLAPEQADEVFAKRVAGILAAPVPILCCNHFLPEALKAVGPDAKHERILALAETMFRRAQRCGIQTITFGSGGARRVPDGFAKDQAATQFTDLLRRLGPLAATHGVTVAVEPLQAKECNFLNTIGEVQAVVGPAQHPAIGITADLYHMVIGGDRPADLERAMPLLKHFHIAEKTKRAMPGVAGDDFRDWFRVVAKHGWNGRVSIESSGGGDREAYSHSFAYLRAQARDAGI